MKLVIGFLLALFLAWPTFGLSLAIWLGWVAFSTYQRRSAAQNSDVMTALLEAIFRGEFREFAHSLELP